MSYIINNYSIQHICPVVIIQGLCHQLFFIHFLFCFCFFSILYIFFQFFQILFSYHYFHSFSCCFFSSFLVFLFISTLFVKFYYISAFFDVKKKSFFIFSSCFLQILNRNLFQNNSLSPFHCDTKFIEISLFIKYAQMVIKISFQYFSKFLTILTSR